MMPILVDMEEYKKNSETDNWVPIVFLPNVFTDISYYGAICNDEDKDDISKYFVPTADFMEDAFATGGCVIVNCVGGISRSSTITASFLMQKRGMALEEALTSMRQKREISPNEGFLLSLVKLEKSLKE